MREKAARSKSARVLAVAGATTAPAHTLYDICRKLPDGAEVALDTTGDAGRLEITCDYCNAQYLFNVDGSSIDQS